MSRSRSKHPTVEIIENLSQEIDRLIDLSLEKPPSASARKSINENVRTIVQRMQEFVADLDPVKQPRAVFDPSDPVVVGRFVALALIAQPRVSLKELEQFYGSGVYAIYYLGSHSNYLPISDSETPIYVGKADPQTDHARSPIEQGNRLLRQLKDHRRSIGKAASTLDLADFECRALVVQSGWQGAAEDYLIQLFRPIWNNETNICYGLGKHGDDPKTRANLRSPWDTLHPGRDWAHRDVTVKDARDEEKIVADLMEHFENQPIYSTVDEILKVFFVGLRQL